MGHQQQNTPSHTDTQAQQLRDPERHAATFRPKVILRRQSCVRNVHCEDEGEAAAATACGLDELENSRSRTWTATRLLDLSYWLRLQIWPELRIVPPATVFMPRSYGLCSTHAQSLRTWTSTRSFRFFLLITLSTLTRAEDSTSG